MKTFALAVIALAIAAPTHATEAPSKTDVAAVDACLALAKENQKKAGPAKDDAPGPAGRLASATQEAARDPQSCISIVTVACMRKDGETDSARITCADRETAVWDQRLNAAYRKALDKMEQEGAENLRKTQRAWIAYRDARCMQAWATWQGTMANPAKAWCEMEATARQALWIEGWIE